jgi:hypothetical protein
MKPALSLFFCILLFYGCEDFFTVDDRNVLKLDNNDDYITVINGLYGQLYKSVYAGGIDQYPIGILKESIGNGDDINFAAEIHNENGNYSSFQYSLMSTYFFGLSPLSGYNYYSKTDYASTYKKLYHTIADANILIKKASDLSRIDFFKKKIIGEVYFIRAYCYFRLVRVYGQVPIVSNTDVNYALKKPSFSELYGLIVSDLQNAIKLLPKTLKDTRVPYETPTIGSSKALLAEVYLTMGGYPLYDKNGYANAAKCAGEVINNSEEYGFGLVNDLADLWNGYNVKNRESVFSLYFSDNNPFVVRYGGNIYCDVCVPQDFYNTFPKNYRKEVTFQTRHVPYNEDLVLDTVLLKWIHINDSLYIKHYDSINNPFVYINYKKIYSQFNIPDSILLKKFKGRYIEIPKYTGQVVYILRFAQTLLTYAEAQARMGNPDASAYEAINKVRRRANKLDISAPSLYDLKPGLTAEQFADSVVQERAWELCAEPEGRWFDMVRLNIAKDLVAIKQHQGVIVYPFPIDRTTYFLPIPEEDKKINTNLE